MPGLRLVVGNHPNRNRHQSHRLPPRLRPAHIARYHRLGHSRRPRPPEALTEQAMQQPPQQGTAAGQRPDWLPADISVVEHVRDAARKAGPPPELDDPDTDWDWDGGDLFSEAWRTGCIPDTDLRRAMGARGEDKPQWYMELKAASGDALYIRDRPQIAMAAASGQPGERARNAYEDMATRGLLDNTPKHRPAKQPKAARSPAIANDEEPELPSKATWKRVGPKTPRSP